MDEKNLVQKLMEEANKNSRGLYSTNVPEDFVRDLSQTIFLEYKIRDSYKTKNQLNKREGIRNDNLWNKRTM